MEAFKPIHQHVIIRATIVDLPASEEVMQTMLQELVEHLGMKPVTKPQTFYVRDLGNEGITGSINLATSHVAFHVWDVSHLLMADIYSCKTFNSQKAIDKLGSYFHGYREYNAIVLNRENNHIEEEIKFQKLKYQLIF
jgi:S-adenosylmethionine/arginine decarboxylase-like enzyme